MHHDVFAAATGPIFAVGVLDGVRCKDLELDVIGGIDVADHQLPVVQAPQRGIAPIGNDDGSSRVSGGAADTVGTDRDRLRLNAAAEVDRGDEIAVGV